MIANLIFDLSGYGGSANFTAATEAILINELNTLTGVTWYWDPADCKPKSNFYPGVPPVITTAYKVSFVDIDGDSTGFCNAGSLDFTKFNEMDLSAYGGSGTTAVANNTDIVNAFAALSLTVSVSGCDLIIDNWDKNNTPTNIEVSNIGGCTVNTQSYGGLSITRESLSEQPLSGLAPFQISYTATLFGNIGNPPITTDFGDGSSPVINTFPYTQPLLHTYPAVAAVYPITSTYIDDNGNTTSSEVFVLVGVVLGEVWFLKGSKEFSPEEIRLNTLQTPITFNTLDCNNITWSLDMPVSFLISQPLVGDQVIEVIFGGNTTSLVTTAGAFGIANFVNIPGTFNIPGSNPLTVNYKTNGVVTASFNVTVVIN